MPKSSKLIVGNWKMNPRTFGEAKDLFAPIKKAVQKYPNAVPVVCPPFVFLNNLRRMDLAGRIFLGAQDVFYEDYGSFTGEVSVEMIKSAGASYVIVGHSERRALGETSDIISKKAAAALKGGLTVILCIGEKERDHEGRYLAVLEEELKQSLQSISRKQAEHLIIAYEPLWAIGKSSKDAMLPGDIHETALFIRKVAAKAYGSDTAFSIPVLYGGSVTPANIEGILKAGEVAGVLVGGASLIASDFIELLKIANNV